VGRRDGRERWATEEGGKERGLGRGEREAQRRGLGFILKIFSLFFFKTVLQQI
jgi:hypothetical protein